MSVARAERRRAEKAAAKAASTGVVGGITPTTGPIHQPQIQLQNPVEAHYASFIIGNAQFCDHVVEEDSAKGQHVVICGAGPSLRENAAEWCPQGDQVWGCNSALTWLIDHGHKATHGFTCDQTPMMVTEWFSAPEVEYLVASTIHPHLTEYLLDKQRTLRFFHNFVGIKRRPVSIPDDEGKPQLMSYEDWLYSTLYPGTVRAGSGLNAVTRAIDIARYMGFAKITVLGVDGNIRIKSQPPEGADFGSPAYLDWIRRDTEMHADGGSAVASDASPLTLSAIIDSGTPDDEIRPGHGRYWLTKIDILVSTIWLIKMQQAFPELHVVADEQTLFHALRNKTDEYLSRLPSFVDKDNNPVPILVK